MQNSGDSRHVHDAAAYWFARMRSDRLSPFERRRFTRWLSSDESHLQAYGEYEQLWAATRGMAADDAILAMRRDALLLGSDTRTGGWRRTAAAAAVLVMAFVIAGLMAVRPFPSTPQPVSVARADMIYRTDVGERSTVTLRDGSVVELNTDSVLQANFTAGERSVRLLRGQALFQVAHDASRPFVVRAADQRITAIGTMFDVRLDAGKMRVTLLEGVVAVERDTESAGRTTTAEIRTLEPGEQLVAVAQAPFRVREVDVAQSVSWRAGQVIFTDEPLGEVLDEINRYSHRKVVLGDPSLAELRVSGVFRAGSVGSFVTALDAAFPISSWHDDSRNRIVLRWDAPRPA